MMEVKSEYNMTEIGEIPSDWEVKKIGDIFHTIANMSLSRNQTVKSGDSFYLHYGDIHKNELNQFDTKKDISWLPMINKNEVSIKENAKLVTGDVVFADASEDLKDMGKNVVVVNEDNSEFYAGLHTISIREIEGKDKLNTDFKGYCFKTEQVKNQIRRLSNGTTVFGISKPNLLSIKFAIPSLKEQQKIAKILSIVDEQIEQTNQLIEKTKELKKGLMQQLLTKGIGHSKFKQTEIGEIPVEWELLMYEEVLELIDGDRSKKYPSGRDIVKQGILFLSTGDIKDDKLDYSRCRFITEEKFESLSKGKLTSGDIITTLRGTLGSVALFQGDRFNTGFINAQMMILRPYKRLDSNFFYYFMISSQFKKQLKAITSGSAQPQLTKKDLKKVKLTLPTKEEQIKIASILFSVDEEISEYRQEKSKYEELKKGLMQQLLTGKTRVKVD